MGNGRVRKQTEDSEVQRLARAGSNLPLPGEGPKGGGGRPRALGSRSRPPRGATAWRPPEGRGTLASTSSSLQRLPVAKPRLSLGQPAGVRCQQGRAGNGGQKHLLDICQTLFSTLSKSSIHSYAAGNVIT